MTVACPSSDRLREALLDEVAEADLALLAAHLERCESCRRALAGLAAGGRPADEWVRPLRRAPVPLGPAMCDVLGNMETQAFFPEPLVRSGSGEPETPASDDQRAKRLGAYSVLKLLGRGGMGVVFLAEDQALGRHVAIKVLAPKLATDAASRERFMREARAAATVNHPNVVTVYSVDELRSVMMMVMEFVDGISLHDRIVRHGPMPIRDIVRIGTQIAAGLAAAHARGLIHRDIKPSNILLAKPHDQVKITDFGLAKAAGETDLGEADSIMGTPSFMSPEQASGRPVDHRADLFSFGSVLYAMCTGRAPYSGDNPIVVTRRVADGPPRPIRSLRPNLPGWLADLIQRLHGREPSDRFQSAAEVAQIFLRHWETTRQAADLVDATLEPASQSGDAAAPATSRALTSGPSGDMPVASVPPPPPGPVPHDAAVRPIHVMMTPASSPAPALQSPALPGYVPASSGYGPGPLPPLGSLPSQNTPPFLAPSQPTIPMPSGPLPLFPASPTPSSQGPAVDIPTPLPAPSSAGPPTPPPVAAPPRVRPMASMPWEESQPAAQPTTTKTTTRESAKPRGWRVALRDPITRWTVFALVSLATVLLVANAVVWWHRIMKRGEPQGETQRAELGRDGLGAFHLIAGDGARRRDCGTLQEAVDAAQPGEAVEIDAAQPIHVGPLRIKDKPIAIRAAAGCSPTLLLRADPADPLAPWIQSESALILEGLDLSGVPETPGAEAPVHLITCRGGPLRLANCRLVHVGAGAAIRLDEIDQAVVRNCLIHSAKNAAIGCRDPKKADVTIQNCAISGEAALALAYGNVKERPTAFVNLRQNTFIVRDAVRFLPGIPLRGRLDAASILSVASAQNVYDVAGALLSVQAERMGPGEADMLVRAVREEDAPSPSPGAKIGALALQTMLGAIKKAVAWADKQPSSLSGDGHPLALTTSAAPQHPLVLGPRMASEWGQFWGGTQFDLVRIPDEVLHGADLRLRAATQPTTLRPADFKPAKTAVKPLASGADLLLLGPGESFETWKRTSDYRDWQTAARGLLENK